MESNHNATSPKGFWVRTHRQLHHTPLDDADEPHYMYDALVYQPPEGGSLAAGHVKPVSLGPLILGDTAWQRLLERHDILTSEGSIPEHIQAPNPISKLFCNSAGRPHLDHSV